MIYYDILWYIILYYIIICLHLICGNWRVHLYQVGTGSHQVGPGIYHWKLAFANQELASTKGELAFTKCEVAYWHWPSANWHTGILACTKWELACMMLAQVPEAHLCLHCKHWEDSVSDKMALGAQGSGLIFERHTSCDKYSAFIWLSRVWPALILAMAVQRGSAAVVSWFCRLDPTHPAQLCLCQAVELHRNALNAQPQKHSRPLRRFRFEFQVVHDKMILKNAHFEICKKMFTPGTSNYFSGFSGLG